MVNPVPDPSAPAPSRAHLRIVWEGATHRVALAIDGHPALVVIVLILLAVLLGHGGELPLMP